MLGQHKNAGKVRMGLVPTFAKWAVAKVMTWAAESGKYGLHDWRNGQFLMEIKDSLDRHLYAWESGEEIDPETGMPHLWEAATRAMMLCEMAQIHPELDDRHVKLNEVEKAMNSENLKKHLIEKFQRRNREELIQEPELPRRDQTVDIHPNASTIDLRPHTETEIIKKARVVEIPCIWIKRTKEGWNKCERCGTEFLDAPDLQAAHKKCEMIFDLLSELDSTETLEQTNSLRMRANGHE